MPISERTAQHDGADTPDRLPKLQRPCRVARYVRRRWLTCLLACWVPLVDVTKLLQLDVQPHVPIYSLPAPTLVLMLPRQAQVFTGISSGTTPRPHLDATSWV